LASQGRFIIFSLVKEGMNELECENEEKGRKEKMRMKEKRNKNKISN